MHNNINENLIQVLWVEDDPTVTGSYPIEAAYEGLQLVPHKCWMDAKYALENHFERWSAIILDAKCKVREDSHDNASTFLMNAISDIKEICANKKRVIPWYVLSGGSEDELQDILNIDKPWDQDWGKPFYSKTTDRELLYTRIRYHVRKQSDYLQVRNEFKDIFSAIEFCKLNDDFENDVEDLLCDVKFPEKSTNDHMAKLRKCMESIFLSMVTNGLIPRDSEHFNEKKGSPNMTTCCLWVAGKPYIKGGEVKIEAPESGSIVTEIMGEEMKDILQIAGADLHTHLEGSTYTDTRDTASYLKDVGNSTYLLRSLIYQFCDILLWYQGYLKHIL